jgi:hypothetical protein
MYMCVVVCVHGMYVVYVYIYIMLWCTSLNVRHVCVLPACMHDIMHIGLCVCADGKWQYVNIYVCLCVCMYVCMCVCLYVCLYVCMCVHMYTYMLWGTPLDALQVYLRVHMRACIMCM